MNAFSYTGRLETLKQFRIAVLAVLFGIVLVPLSTFGQVTIGNGTLENQALPIEPFFGFTYSQSIYTQAEINAAGMITSISWVFDGTATSTLANTQNIEIYLGHTTKADFISNTDWIPVSGLTLVYAGPLGTPPAGGLGQMTVNLTTPFAYNNTDNLVIAVDENTPSFDSGADDFLCTATGTVVRSLTFRSDGINPDPTAPPAASFQQTAISNVVLGGITQAFPTPTALAASNATTNSVDLAWSQLGAATQWEIEYGAPGFAVGTGAGTLVTGVGTNPFTLTGLSSSTTFDIYLRSNDGAGGISSWAGPVSAMTLCAPITVYPSNTAFATNPPNSCWDEAGDGEIATGPTGLGASDWGTRTTLPTPTNVMNLFTGDNDREWLLSGQYDLSTGGPFELNIDVAVTNFFGANAATMGSDDQVDVLISTDNGVTWTSIQSWSLANQNQPTNTLTTVNIPLSAFSGVVQFAIFASDGLTDDPEDYDFHVGAFQVRTVPNCQDPTALMASNISATSAELSWTENGTASLYNVEWGTAGFIQGNGTVETGVANPFTLTGLSAFTNYEYYVQADCGAVNGLSPWVGPFAFQTALAPLATPTCFDFENVASNLVTGPITLANGWFLANVQGGDPDWTTDVGGTTSGVTGPSVDHTTGTATGVYVYLETSGGLAGEPDFLQAPPLDLTGSGANPVADFWYHMFGATMGTLNFQVSTDGGTTWTTLWSESGDQGDVWLNKVVDLTPFANNANILFRFEGIRGTSFTGDMAIDDFCISSGLPIAVTGTPYSACQGGSFDLAFTTGGGADQYTLMFDQAALDAGFVDVAATTLPSSPISVTVPATATPGSYIAEFQVINSTTGDVSGCVAIPFDVLGFEVAETIDSDGNLCFGSANGTIDLEVTPAGTYTFAWSNGATTEDITGLAAGSYTVTVDDGTCSVVLNYDVEGPDQLVLSASITDDTSCDTDNGAIDLTISGGTEISAFGPETTLTSSFTSNNGCNGNAFDITTLEDVQITGFEVNVTGTANIDIEVYWRAGTYSGFTDDIANWNFAGSVSVLPAGLDLPTTVTLPAPINLPAGNYAIKIGSPSGGWRYIGAAAPATGVGNLWASDGSIEIFEGAGACAFPFNTNTPLEPRNFSGSIIYETLVPLASAYTINWSNGATSEDLTDLADGNYDVVVTDANGCTATASYTVAPPSVPALSFTTVSATDCSTSDGSVDMTVTGGVAPITYAWSNGATTEDLTGVPPADFTVTVTAAGNCTAVGNITVGSIGSASAPPVVLTQDITVTLDATTGLATILATDVDNNSRGCNDLTFTVSPNSFDCSNVGANTVTLTVNDATLGLSSTGTAVVTIVGSQACEDNGSIEILNDLDNSNNGINYTYNPTVADPCTCDGNGGFDEEVIVTDNAAGRTWTVTAVTGLAGITVGTVATDNGDGTYSLISNHADGVGYTVTLENPVDYPGVQLMIGNTCFYPAANITTDLAQVACLGTAPITLTGEGVSQRDPAVQVAGSGTFRVNGQVRTQLLPASLGVGTHTVQYCFDAGAALGTSTGATLDAAQDDPGCETCVTGTFEVLATPRQLNCNDRVNVSLNANCSTFITPDMILEGDLVCEDDYTVVLKINGQVIPNPVTGAYFGRVITTEVTHGPSGNKCWGELVVEDKLAPTINCAGPITASCTADVATLPFPTAVDGCSNAVVQLVDLQQTDADICDDNTIRYIRTFIAVDAAGNPSLPCVQTVLVNRTSVTFPRDIAWTCEQYNANNNVTGATALAPSIVDGDLSTPNVIDVRLLVGSPALATTGSGVPAGTTGTACMYQVSNSDLVLPACGSTFKILRTWTVFDWCANAVITADQNGNDNVQVIKILDETEPTVSTAYFTVSTNVVGVHPQPCMSTGLLPVPAMSDNCSGIVDSKAYIFRSAGLRSTVATGNAIGQSLPEMVGGTVLGYRIPSPGLQVGHYVANYQVTDACGNVGDAFVAFSVIDDVIPTVSCDQITEVNISSDGLAVVQATVFNDGSTDNCCIDRYEVRRMTNSCNIAADLNFGPSITVCCDDVANSPIMVEMQVVDCYGNTNSCMVEVFVNDKIAPQCLGAPGLQFISCDQFFDVLQTPLELGDSILFDLYGDASFYDNCALNIEYSENVSVDNCGNGQIVRSWIATDNNPNSIPARCSQVILVSHTSDWSVEFPDDVATTCDNTSGINLDSTATTGEPIIFFETCELIGTTYEDRTFTNVVDACYKIERTWTVINWCIYDANAKNATIESSELAIVTNVPDVNGDLRANTYDPAQDLHPTVVGEELGLGDELSGTPNDHLPEAGDIVPNDARTFKDGVNVTRLLAGQAPAPDGYITYKQVIKIDDQFAPVLTCNDREFCETSTNCGPVFADLSIDIADACSDQFVVSYAIDAFYDAATPFQADFTGSGNNSNIANGNYPLGAHLIRWTVEDRCGNVSSCSFEFEIKDCKKPTPYCKNGLVIEIMQTGMVQTWASDLNDGSFDNCPGNLKFSFSSNVLDTGRVFTCDSLGQRSVQIWVTDASGNQDFCETFVIIQDNMNACQGATPRYTVGGATRTETDVDVDGVEVALNGTMSAMTTTVDGQFNFANVPGGDYTIAPMRDVNHAAGVTTWDLVLIARHILGTELLDSPYKLIAADATHDNRLSASDLLVLRSLVLTSISELPNNTSWRFVPTAHVFDNPMMPFTPAAGFTAAQPFPEVININNLSASQLNANFVAIKVGDVNGSYNPSTLTGRNYNGNVELRTNDVMMKTGNKYEVAITAAQAKLLGAQFTLNFDRQALHFEDLREGVLKTNNFGFHLTNDGALTASWNSTEATALTADQTLFTVVFTAKTDIALSEVISVDSRYTAAEAYSANGDLMNVSLGFNNGKVAAAQFELLQNTPNPFVDVTTIGFVLPTAGDATLTIMDVQGKVIYTVDGQFAKGYNNFTVKGSDLPAQGVFYYELKSADYSATKSMVRIN